MTEGIQKIYETLGRSGCYFLSLLRACEIKTGKTFDPVAIYRYAVENKWMMDDCFLTQPECIVNFLTKKKTIVYKSTTLEDKAFITIVMYHNDRTNLDHFVLVTEDGSIWDPYGKSKTVAEGYVKSYRIFI